MSNAPLNESEPLPEGTQPVGSNNPGPEADTQAGEPVIGSANPGPAAEPQPAADPGHIGEHPAEASWEDYPPETAPGPIATSDEAFAAKRSPRRRGGGGVVALALVGALVVGGISGGLVGAGISGSKTADSQPSSSASTDSSGVRSVQERSDSNLTRVVQASMPSVVTIGVQVQGGDAGTGSGNVLNAQGYIVTNAHVATLEGESASATLSVQTSTGDVYPAKLVGYDALADTAVIKIAANAKGIKPVTFADSDLVQTGDATIAIGSPLGLQGTVTSGIISATNRPISIASSDVNAQQNASVSLNTFQTDAAINQGNSGGALLNSAGDLIGMNDAIATSGGSSDGLSSGSTGSIGIGFSIPANYVKRVAQEIIAKGYATHGLLGATVGEAAQSQSQAFGFGARVQQVSAGGAAAAAGLRAGDVITKLDSTVITDATQLTALVKEDAAGANVKVTFKRGSATQSATVKLGSVPRS